MEHDPFGDESDLYQWIRINKPELSHEEAMKILSEIQFFVEKKYL